MAQLCIIHTPRQVKRDEVTENVITEILAESRVVHYKSKRGNYLRYIDRERENLLIIHWTLKSSLCFVLKINSYVLEIGRMLLAV
jgi:hypothetical protein